MQAQLRKVKAVRCVCGLKKRGPNHEKGEHHQAYMGAIKNLSRDCRRDVK